MFHRDKQHWNCVIATKDASKHFNLTLVPSAYRWQSSVWKLRNFSPKSRKLPVHLLHEADQVVLTEDKIFQTVTTSLLIINGLETPGLHEL